MVKTVHTQVCPIRGDGSSGVCSVTVSSGAVTAVTVTNRTGYTFVYIELQTLAQVQQV